MHRCKKRRTFHCFSLQVLRGYVTIELKIGKGERSLEQSCFVCPVCGRPLFCDERTFVCESRHSFDRAKSGYVNLLQSNRKHAAVPGDNKEMVEARSAFLNAGYYEPLLNAVFEEVRRHMPEKNAFVLDAGCGEGYYTKAIAEAAGDARVAGVDISKSALAAAARRVKNVQFAAGSVFRLPVADASCDMVTELFAPYCGDEFLRVLKPDGVFLSVIPGARHLFGLKTLLYETPYENAVKPFSLPGFSFVSKREVKKTITIQNKTDLWNLFAMTPYAYRTKHEAQEKLLSCSALTTEISFWILAYRKIKGA